MTFFRIFTEVTGGSTIGIILLVLFSLIFAGTSFYMVKKYYSVTSTLNLTFGILIYLVISVVLSDVLLNILLFPHGEYFNYGLGGGLFRIFISILIGLMIGFLITRLGYFKLVKKSILNGC
jgi:hypothetical protein